MNRVLPWMLVLALVAGALVFAYLYMFTPVTTVILVRHAEKNNESDTSSITAGGMERAAALAAAVRDAGVTHIFVSDRIRTRLTAMPAAGRLNINPSVIPVDRPAQVVDSIRARPGETILVVGHNTTILAILTALGVHEPVSVARDVYDDLFVVTVAPFRSSLVHLKYGRPS
jgi:broad specificity phosphatase PhoE